MSTDTTQPISVNLGARSYPIVFGDAFNDLASAATPVVGGRTCAIVSNPTVWALYGEQVADALRKAGATTTHALVPDGEEFKNMTELDRLLEHLAHCALDRTSVVAALGGGVVGDIAGFAAATYMRGIGCIQVPTTLLAQVDSSVGGKTGVNLDAGKNLVGAFHQPRLVYVNWATLATLPLRESRAGYAEVIKYGVIADAALFAQLEQATPALFDGLAARPPRIEPALGAIVRRCSEIKADVVSQDERESGLRAILNYGHTFAHAIEVLAGYRGIVHGEAVAMGMHAAAVFACALGLCSADMVRRQKALIEAAGLPTAFPDLPAEKVIEAFRHDKKTAGARLKFVLPREIGKVEIVTNPDQQLLRAAIESSRK